LSVFLPLSTIVAILWNVAVHPKFPNVFWFIAVFELQKYIEIVIQGQNTNYSSEGNKVQST